MAVFTVNELLSATGGCLLAGSPSVPASRLSIDSRTVKPGEFFVAIRGHQFDGHAFVAEAFRKGATGALVQRGHRSSFPRARRRPVPVVVGVDDTVRAFQDLAGFHRRRFAIPVIAISGSNGKTTTTQMIASILWQEFRLTQTQGNRNNHIGVPLMLLRLTRRHQVAVLEMGISQGGELTQLCRIARPTIGVLTNIGHAHLAGLKRLDGVARAKGELVASLPSDGIAVLNADDAYFPFLRSVANGRIVSFGFSTGADVRIHNLRPTRSHAWTFALHRPGYRRSVGVRLQALGRHNVINAAAASAVGFAMGVKPTAVRHGLANFHPVAMRMEIVEWNNVTMLNDTYNANPASMGVAIEALGDMHGKGRRIAVLGDMLELGRASKAAHENIGALVVRHRIHVLIVCGSMGMHVAAGAVRAGMCRDHIVVTCDAPGMGYPSVTACLADCLVAGDMVLVKGSRAMRMECIVEWWRQYSSRRRAKAR